MRINASYPLKAPALAPNSDMPLQSLRLGYFPFYCAAQRFNIYYLTLIRLLMVSDGQKTLMILLGIYGMFITYTLRPQTFLVREVLINALVLHYMYFCNSFEYNITLHITSLL